MHTCGAQVAAQCNLSIERSYPDALHDSQNTKSIHFGGLGKMVPLHSAQSISFAAILQLRLHNKLFAFPPGLLLWQLDNNFERAKGLQAE